MRCTMFNALVRYKNERMRMPGIKTTLKYIAPFVIIWLTQGCRIINPAEQVPTYVHIDSFAFQRDSALSLSLSSSHQINSVWAYYNNNPIGVFDLPVTFPVITNGTGVLSLYPGIAVSGLNSFLAKYPFYMADTLNLIPQPGKVVHHIPITKYFTATRFYPQTSINFENHITSFTLVDGTAEMGITTDPSQVFEGEGSGIIKLTSPTDTLSESSYNVDFSIPVGVDAYIELNYNNTVPFYLGMQSNLTGGIVYKRYLSGINTSSGQWKKFYLGVKDFAGQYRGDNYTFFIKAYLPQGQASGTVLLDNIQLVYFD